MDKVLVTVIPRTLREGEREILGMEGGKVAVSFFPFVYKNDSQNSRGQGQGLLRG